MQTRNQLRRSEREIQDLRRENEILREAFRPAGPTRDLIDSLVGQTDGPRESGVRCDRGQMTWPAPEDAHIQWWAARAEGELVMAAR